MKLWRRTSEPLWEVVERHFEEAEFLAQCWRDALDEPDVTLDELASGLERRLFEHLDALGFAGGAMLEHVCWPALLDAEVEVSLALVSAFGVLANGEADDCRRLLVVLGESEVGSERWRGLSEALGLSERDGLESWLLTELGSANEGSMTAGVVSALAHRRARLGSRLDTLLASRDPDVLAAAALLARSGSSKQLEMVAGLGQHPDPRVVAAAVETSLVRGVAGAVDVARYWAFDAPSSKLRPAALLWMGVLGHPNDQQRLITMLGEPEQRRDVLWALGFGGSADAVDAVLPLLGDDDLAPLAAEVVSAIGGLPIDDESLWLERVPRDDELPNLLDEQLDIPLGFDPEALLPAPNPTAVIDWWSAKSQGLDRGRRLLGGESLDDASLMRALLEQPMRRRHALGLLAEIRSQGALQIATRDWARTQIHELSVS